MEARKRGDFAARSFVFCLKNSTLKLDPHQSKLLTERDYCFESQWPELAGTRSITTHLLRLK